MNRVPRGSGQIPSKLKLRKTSPCGLTIPLLSHSTVAVFAAMLLLYVRRAGNFGVSAHLHGVNTFSTTMLLAPTTKCDGGALLTTLLPSPICTALAQNSPTVWSKQPNEGTRLVHSTCGLICSCQRALWCPVTPRYVPISPQKAPQKPQNLCSLHADPNQELAISWAPWFKGGALARRARARPIAGLLC